MLLRTTLIGSLLVLTSACSSAASPTTAEAQVWFSPKGGAKAAIVSEIDRAQKSIRAGAYKFESREIAEALVRAKERGLDVAVVMDTRNSKYKKSLRDELASRGVSVFVDGKHAIFHNKVMVIDDRVVPTGSFNYKDDAENDNAENDNAENMLRLESAELARRYAADWEKHRAHAKPVPSKPINCN